MLACLSALGLFAPVIRCTAFLVASITVVPVARAGEFNSGKLADIDAAIEKAITNKRIPGGVFWLENKDAVYHKAYGHRVVEPAPVPMTADTIFDAASLTKVVATTPAIMLLIERGQILLDAPVRNYVPEFNTEGKDVITIRQLLNHTSGLRPDVDTKPPWEGYQTAMTLAYQEKLRTAPGTVFRYSDINFFLLGEVVQRVTGGPLQDFVSHEIYRPLQMTNTGFLPPAEKADRIAPTERFAEKMLLGNVHDPTARFMGGVAGHAGLFTTAADLARYARMLMRGGELDGARIFQPQTIKTMTAVQTPDTIDERRGLGWDIDSGYSRPRGKLFPLGSYGHTGFTGTCLWIDPFSETFWIFLSSRLHPDGKGNVLPLQATLGTLAAQAVPGFDFAQVPGELPARRRVASLGSGREQPPKSSPVLNGIDVLLRENFAPLKNLRIGLISNHTGIDRNRKSTIDLLHEAPDVKLKALFSPEHGIRGALDENVADSVDQKTGLPIYSLYGVRRTPDPVQLEGLDALVFDIQDIGCRFYTYVATMGNCMEAAAKSGLKFFVLDRVNPINGVTVEGPIYRGEEAKFISYHAIPLRHGMTVGELARMFNAEKKFGADLTVIPVEGWTRDMWFDQTELPWINPSPNMRSLTQATLYPGVGLHETALSVGRGTDTPFEVLGAPYIDDLALARELNRVALPGIRFVPVRFTPTASVFRGVACGGVNLIVTDRQRLRPVDVGIAVGLSLRAMYPEQYALDKVQTLLQDKTTLEATRAGKSLDEVRQLWVEGGDAFALRRKSYLIYPLKSD